MKASLLTRLVSSVGGLGLAVGVCLWPTVSQAQGFCYIVDAAGRVTNLDDLCESGGASERSPQSETPGADSAQTDAAPPESRFTILGTPTDAAPREVEGEISGEIIDAESAVSEPTAGQTPSEEPRGNQSTEEQPAGSQARPGIPVETITPPTIEVPQIQTPAVPDSAAPNSAAPDAAVPAP